MLLLINTRLQSITIEHQQRERRSVRGAFVAVNERMVLNQRITKRGCFFGKRGIQISPANSRSGLCDGRLQRALVANSRMPARLRDHGNVQVFHFLDCRIKNHAKRR